MMQLVPVQEVARHYNLDVDPFIRGIERGRLYAEKRDDGYYTSVAWMEVARAEHGISARGGR